MMVEYLADTTYILSNPIESVTSYVCMYIDHKCINKHHVGGWSGGGGESEEKGFNKRDKPATIFNRISGYSYKTNMYMYL